MDQGRAPNSAAAAQLERWRAPLYAAGLVGHYEEHNVGYGNISVRCPRHRQFLISGTQTGQLETTTAMHYALVSTYDMNANVAYGTPQMAREFRRLYLDSNFRHCGLAVMAGHDKGLVSVGATLSEATKRILTLAAP